LKAKANKTTNPAMAEAIISIVSVGKRLVWAVVGVGAGHKFLYFKSISN